MIAATIALAGAPAAPADTARLVPAGTSDGATGGTIVVTDVAGRQRTLGPFAGEMPLAGLTRSPDGRWFAVLHGYRDLIGAITIVPTDGGAPFGFRLGPAGPVATVATTSQVSWSADGEELVIGYANHADGGAGLAVLRCAIVTRVCVPVPGISGMATTVPNGILSVTGYGELVPRLRPWTGPRHRLRPAELRDLRQRRTARIALTAAAGTTTIQADRVNALDGLHGTVGLLGGPSGALLVQQRYRATLTRRSDGWTARQHHGGARWTIISPDGRSRTRAAPRLTVPRAHGAAGRRYDRVLGQRAAVQPAVSRSSGGWLGTVGDRTYVGSGDGLVLTQITAAGDATFVRTGGALASAATLVHRLGRAAVPGTPALFLLAHEASTDAAIALVVWEPKRRPSVEHAAVVRVPLDGRTAPTPIRDRVTRLSEIEQVAW